LKQFLYFIILYDVSFFHRNLLFIWFELVKWESWRISSQRQVGHYLKKNNVYDLLSNSIFTIFQSKMVLLHCLDHMLQQSHHFDMLQFHVKTINNLVFLSIFHLLNFNILFIKEWKWSFFFIGFSFLQILNSILQHKKIQIENLQCKDFKLREYLKFDGILWLC